MMTVNRTLEIHLYKLLYLNQSIQMIKMVSFITSDIVNASKHSSQLMLHWILEESFSMHLTREKHLILLSSKSINIDIMMFDSLFNEGATVIREKIQTFNIEKE